MNNPVVIPTLVSYNMDRAMTVRIKDVDATGFMAKTTCMPGQDCSSTETMAWVAWDTVTINNNLYVTTIPYGSRD